MNIYKLERNDSHKIDWDQYCGFVVGAKDHKQVKELVENYMNEYYNADRQDISWFDVKLVGYKIDSKAEIILVDFNQG